MATEDPNAGIIEEFRANEGRVGGYFEGRTLLLLHTTGRRTGLERVKPLAYQSVGETFAVFASKAGAPTNPDWFHNLVANPDVALEVGTETFPAKARVTAGEEREQIWTRQVTDAPIFGEYQEKSGRTIPVIVLERWASSDAGAAAGSRSRPVRSRPA